MATSFRVLIQLPKGRRSEQWHPGGYGLLIRRDNGFRADGSAALGTDVRPSVSLADQFPK